MATIGTREDRQRVRRRNRHPQRPGQERPHRPRDKPATGENAPAASTSAAPRSAPLDQALNEGRDYLGLKLDDPSFTAPICANLFDDEDGKGHSLIWSRPTGRRSD